MNNLISPSLFTYATNRVTVNANSSAEDQIVISNDSDFLLSEIRATKQSSNNSIIMQMKMSGGDLFSNVALDTNQFAGDNYPVRVTPPVRIPANTQLVFTFTNTTGGNLVTQIQLWGYKVKTV